MAALPCAMSRHTDSLHWRGALGYNSLISDGSVFLYDSLVGNTETLPLSLKEQFSTVYKCAANDSALIVTQYPVQQQSGSTDCGLFSIAFAYHAAIGDNLRTLIFDQGRMRSHLLSCFERSEITPFPLATTTTDTIRRCALRHHVIIHCTCRMPESGKMIQCEVCYQWYHYVCASIKRAPKRWKCFLCLKDK